MGFARVLEKSFVNNTLVEEGQIIPYSGKYGSNLQPCDADGKPLKKGKDDKPEAETLA